MENFFAKHDAPLDSQRPDENDKSGTPVMAQEPPKHEEIVEASPDPVPPLTPTVYMFTTCGGTPKTIETPPHPWEPRQQGEHADGPETASENPSYEDEDLELTKKVLDSEFAVVADISNASAARSGHNPLPEMGPEALSPTLREMAMVDDKIVSRADQNKTRKRKRAEGDGEGSEEDSEEVRKKPAGKSRAKAKAKAKATSKAKAKPKAKAAAKKGSPVKKGSPKSVKKAASPKAKAKGKKTPTKGKGTKTTPTKGKGTKTPTKGKGKKSKQAEEAKVDKKVEKPVTDKSKKPARSGGDTGKTPKSFARRYPPKNPDGALWWTALRDAYYELVRPKIKFPSRSED